MRRLGLLGGTFDPVHAGHLAAGRAARVALALDQVQLVPARPAGLDAAPLRDGGAGRPR
jgi:nicotinate-nucleotide adenylyltransferase